MNRENDSFSQIAEKKRKDRQQNLKLLTLVSQFGFTMLTPMLLGFFIGLAIDRRFGTSFWMIILFFFGAVIGFRNVYVLATGSMTRHNYHRQKEEDVLPTFEKTKKEEDQSDGTV